MLSAFVPLFLFRFHLFPSGQYFGRGADDATPDRYMPHCDGDCTGLKHKYGSRMATVVMYCTVADRGGHTNFRNAGVHVKPERGNAIFFSYIDPETLTMDSGFTEHSGTSLNSFCSLATFPSTCTRIIQYPDLTSPLNFRISFLKGVRYSKARRKSSLSGFDTASMMIILGIHLTLSVLATRSWNILTLMTTKNGPATTKHHVIYR